MVLLISAAQWHCDSGFVAAAILDRAGEAKAFEALAKMAETLHALPVNATCERMVAGQDYGHHVLCNSIPQNCLFYSFGINNDYSFDIELATRFNCKGIGFDPTVTHLSKLHNRVYFLPMAASSLATERKFDLVTTVPAFRLWQHHDFIDILKMDCEGCEYALAEDILREDPTFFKNVGQFVVEVHVGNKWITSHQHVVNLGMLFVLLEEAGLRLQNAKIVGCSPWDEELGCPDSLTKLNYPCTRPGFGQCHMYAFSRI